MNAEERLLKSVKIQVLVSFALILQLGSVTVVDMSANISTATPVRLSRPPSLIGRELFKDHPSVYLCSLRTLEVHLLESCLCGFSGVALLL